MLVIKKSTRFVLGCLDLVSQALKWAKDFLFNFRVWKVPYRIRVGMLFESDRMEPMETSVRRWNGHLMFGTLMRFVFHGFEKEKIIYKSFELWIHIGQWAVGIPARDWHLVRVHEDLYIVNHHGEEHDRISPKGYIETNQKLVGDFERMVLSETTELPASFKSGKKTHEFVERLGLSVEKEEGDILHLKRPVTLVDLGWWGDHKGNSRGERFGIMLKGKRICTLAKPYPWTGDARPYLLLDSGGVGIR